MAQDVVYVGGGNTASLLAVWRTHAALRDGLGLLPGSECPHYDGEDQRRPLYRRLIADEGFPPGFAADDAAALVFEGTALREVVCTLEGSTAYRVEPDGEVALAARLL